MSNLRIRTRVILELHVNAYLLTAACVGWILLSVSPASADDLGFGSLNPVAIETELKTVKLYGAGGIAGLDSYQSGFFISDEGHILTAWSTVLDVDQVIAIGSDGSRYEATVVGIDPNLEIAVLSTGQRPPDFFQIDQAEAATIGQRVLAFSNLFGIATGSEMASVQHGNVMAITDLEARRGAIESVYQGRVYIIDAMTNNPGAAGGALTNINGQLLAMLGKELRDSRANIWLNYALPISVLKDSVQRILDGEPILRQRDNRLAADRPVELNALGITLIPDVLAKTPAYVDIVKPKSISDRAGLKSDDLILFVNSIRITSQSSLAEELRYIDRSDDLIFLVQRGRELLQLAFSAP